MLDSMEGIILNVDDFTMTSFVNREGRNINIKYYHWNGVPVLLSESPAPPTAFKLSVEARSNEYLNSCEGYAIDLNSKFLESNYLDVYMACALGTVRLYQVGLRIATLSEEEIRESTKSTQLFCV